MLALNRSRSKLNSPNRSVIAFVIAATVGSGENYEHAHMNETRTGRRVVVCLHFHDNCVLERMRHLVARKHHVRI